MLYYKLRIVKKIGGYMFKWFKSFNKEETMIKISISSVTKTQASDENKDDNKMLELKSARSTASESSDPKVVKKDDGADLHYHLPQNFFRTEDISLSKNSEPQSSLNHHETSKETDKEYIKGMLLRTSNENYDEPLLFSVHKSNPPKSHITESTYIEGGVTSSKILKLDHGHVKNKHGEIVSTNHSKDTHELSSDTLAFIKAMQDYSLKPGESVKHETISVELSNHCSKTLSNQGSSNNNDNNNSSGVNTLKALGGFVHDILGAVRNEEEVC